MVPPHLHSECLWGQVEPGPGSLDTQAEAPLFPRPRCATATSATAGMRPAPGTFAIFVAR